MPFKACIPLLIFCPEDLSIGVSVVWMSPSSIVSISPSMAVRFCLMYWHGFMLGKLLLFSHPVMFNFLWPHGMQHTRPPCPSSSPKVCPSSCPLHQWCHPASLSSDTLFSFYLQSFPASGCFLVSGLFALGGQIIGALASPSVLPMSTQGLFPLGLTGLILLSKGLSRVFSSITIQKHQFFCVQPSLWSNSYIYTWLLERP